MKARSAFPLAAAAFLVATPCASAQTVLFNGVNKNILDNNPAGISDTRTVSLPGNLPIADLNLSVNIDPRGASMFNGDIYLTLAKGNEGFAVLLNRVGLGAGSALGYGDNGFHIRLDDDAAHDVHTYRLNVTGSASIPLTTNPLTGSWQPDAREVDPDSVVTADPRSAFLAAFDGLTPNGEWTLFAADLSGSGAAKLASWSLEFTLVPEPPQTATVVGALLLVGWASRCLASKKRMRGSQARNRAEFIPRSPERP